VILELPRVKCCVLSRQYLRGAFTRRAKVGAASFEDLTRIQFDLMNTGTSGVGLTAAVMRDKTTNVSAWNRDVTTPSASCVSNAADN
jgi:hypothetical protein